MSQNKFKLTLLTTTLLEAKIKFLSEREKREVQEEIGENERRKEKKRGEKKD